MVNSVLASAPQLTQASSAPPSGMPPSGPRVLPKRSVRVSVSPHDTLPMAVPRASSTSLES